MFSADYLIIDMFTFMPRQFQSPPETAASRSVSLQVKVKKPGVCTFVFLGKRQETLLKIEIQRVCICIDRYRTGDQAFRRSDDEVARAKGVHQARFFTFPLDAIHT